jgi:YVTN family beta-propeller protein
MIKKTPGLFVLIILIICSHSAYANFVAFESGHVRPLAISPDGNRLFAVNTPDNRLEIFTITNNGLIPEASVPVGMEPVAVAARNNNEVWVVNHLSDSVSVVDVSINPPRVVRTLLVGDEPRDIVFAGFGKERAFITTAHRGQNSPYSPVLMPLDPGQSTMEGIGRADVWVFDATNLGTSLGGDELTILSLFTDTPRALTVSADGNTVYAAGFHTGNKTSVVTGGGVCPGGSSASACTIEGVMAPGGLPAPNKNNAGITGPEVGLIVKHDGANWVDELDRNWNNQVPFSLPDTDVFAINVNHTDISSGLPTVTTAFASVGTILYNMIVNPVSGKVYVSNTEANNLTRFEGTRDAGDTNSTVVGNLHKARITVLDGASVVPRHLNKHIDYSIVPAPLGMAISITGDTLYLAAFGSSKIGIFNTSDLEDDSFVPSSSNHITVSGGGPTGLILNEPKSELYVLTRFDNSISVINTTSKTEKSHIALHNPEPAPVLVGRPFLYDANLTSSNGEASCGACHVFGDLDSLAWDLGDPSGDVATNGNESVPFSEVLGGRDYHPMKGPMTTQSLRGMANHGPTHWRGDRQADINAVNTEEISFLQFNPAFVGLVGRGTPLTSTEMQLFTNFALDITYPPNPNRPLDNGMTPKQQAGHDMFVDVANKIDGGFASCDECHTLNEAVGQFGSNGQITSDGETQDFKIPHLRNLYQKVGRFGMPANLGIVPGDNIDMQEQIRGFGFLHDGSTDTLFRFFGVGAFTFSGDTILKGEMEQFMLAFDSNLKPIVGQQVTLTSSNAATVASRLNLLIARANVGDSDLIVKGTVAGVPEGWRLRNDGLFESDSGGVLTDSQLRAIAQTPGQSLTYTAVPLGSGIRMGIDRDEDNVLDGNDNCPAVANPGQEDDDSNNIGNVCEIIVGSDGDDDSDGVPNSLDNCLGVANVNQLDTDTDGIGDACDSDDDNDGVLDGVDVFPLDPSETTDTDSDGIGNNADPDDDNDGVPDGADNCPIVVNASQLDTDTDGLGDACDPDDDNDGVLDGVDAFPLDPTETIDTDSDGIGNNADPDDDNDGALDGVDAFPLDPTETTDIDSDGIGDNADPDDDNDSVLDGADNCPVVANTSQLDTDTDGLGDACDPDDDNDGILDSVDNCPLISNSDQQDTDNDGVGDVCDGVKVLQFDNTSFFELDLAPEDGFFEFNTPLTTGPDGGIVIGMIQPASGSHAGPPDGTESPGIDQPWVILGTSMHLSTSPVVFLDPGTLDFSGWALHTNGSVTLLSDPANFPDSLVATITCDTASCAQGENFALDYLGHIPLGDPSGFGGTNYHLVMNGSIVIAADTDADTIPDNIDNCPFFANTDQLDSDSDGIGDACEIDFDSDGLPDSFDNCPLIANTDQLDTDSDGVGNVCDADDDNDGLSDALEGTIGTNPLLIDSDDDSLSDFFEVNYDSDPNNYTPGADLNPLAADSDGDGFNDDVEIDIGSNPLDILSIPADGDINNDGSVNAADLLLATQIALGLKTPTAAEMLHGDVAPLTAGVPAPDGVINAGDLLVIQRKVLGLVSF